jgi:DNA invertase Pin-like site-specific DNA recombinase
MRRPLAVIYARVSKPGEKSPADQEKVGRRDLEQQGYDVVRVFKDKQSASRYRRVRERKGFTDMQAYVRDEGIDLLWTFANNRAHRDLDDYVLLRRLCIELGMKWRYGNRTYDLSKSSDRRATNADALRAEEYSDDLKDATLRGTEEALAAGLAHGKLPRGYRIIRDPITGDPIRREPIPEQAALLRRAAERILADESMRSVARDLAEEWERIGARGFMDQRTLRALFLNPTFAGLRTSKGEVVREGTNWDPIFTVEQHEQLAVILRDPKRRKQQGTEPKHLLSYLAVCAVCEMGVSTKNPPKSRPDSPAMYRCPNGHVYRPIKDTEAHVEEFVIHYLRNPEIKALLDAPPEGMEAVSIDEDLAAIQVLTDSKKEFARYAAREKLPFPMIVEWNAETDEQIAVHRARIDAVTRDPFLDDVFGPDAGERWGKRTLESRRNIVRRLLRVEIRPIGRGNSGLGVEIYPRDTRSQNAEM